jgi:hypothetical protein
MLGSVFKGVEARSSFSEEKEPKRLLLISPVHAARPKPN